MKTIMITGVAGFIGSKVAEDLLKEGYQIIGLDNLNHYYDIRLKDQRLKNLVKFDHFKFFQMDIEHYELLESLFQKFAIHAIINEAARAGIRASIENPFIYQKTNIQGNLNLLELCKKYGVLHYVLASTSSVYSGCKEPFQEEYVTDYPFSPYAATKKSAELIAYCYHYLYQINITVLRYFTVYGPSCRPDMSIFRFIKWIIAEGKVQIYGDGKQERDFTYVDDIAVGTIKAMKLKGFHIINLGNNQPYSLLQLIQFIEKYSGKKADLVFLPSYQEDMKSTRADIRRADQVLGWTPEISLDEGIKRTVQWMTENWAWVKDIKV